MGSFAELASQIDTSEPAGGPGQQSGNFAELAKTIDVKAKPTSSAKPNLKEQGYFSKVAEAGREVRRTVTPSNLKPALAEAAIGAVTGAPIGLIKHGVEEGAYLSGQDSAQAAQTAQRVIPTDGMQPTSPAGQAISNFVSAAGQPLVDVGRWAAEKAGLSPAAQNIAGDFSPVVVPKMASSAVSGIGRAADAINNAPPLTDVAGLARDIGKQGSLSQMQQRYAQLAAEGRAPVAQGAPTPQQIRGQDPTPEPVMVDKAPPITVENASPQLQKIIAEAGPNPNKTAVTRQLEADALPVRVRLSEGQATGDHHILSDEFNRRGTPQGKPYADLFREQNGQLIENLNAIRDKAAPKASGFDHVENGDTLIGAYKAKDSLIRQDISAKYKALEDANGGQFPLDGKQFVDSADAALAKKLKSHYVPPEVRSTLNDLRDGGKMTFEDFETLRSDLADTARSAADGKVRAAASIIRDQLENLPMPKGAEHLKPLADSARSAAKARFDLLEGDPAYKAAVNDAVAADKFVQKYIVNGNKSDLAKMKDYLADNVDAQQSIAAGALNYLKAKSGIVNDSGNFSQAGYNKALEALKPKLDYLFDPVTAQQAQTLGKVANYVQQQPRGSYFNNSGTAVTLMRDAALGGAEGYLNFKTMGVYDTVKGMMKGGKEAKAAAEAVKPGAGIPLKDLK